MSIRERAADELSPYLEFRSGDTLVADGYLYLHEMWYEIVEIAGNRVLGSLAETSTPSDLGIELDPENLYVTLPADAPVRFRRGQPHLADWPDSELIYVDEAYCGNSLSGTANTSKRVHGLFLRQMDLEDGTECYCPLNPGEQGIPAEWILRPDRDPVVSWRPVKASEILEVIGK